LNVQVPFSTPINTQYQISVQRDSLISLPEQLVVAQANPGVFTVNEQGTGQGVIFKHDGVTLAQAGTPANQGETVVIYCTGLGAVTPAVPDGAPAPASPLSNTVNPATVTIGGQNATVAFSGLTPGYPGLYQVNAVVPNGVSGAAVPVVVTVAEQPSPSVTMAVQ
jgi:adhesin/invasin